MRSDVLVLATYIVSALRTLLTGLRSICLTFLSLSERLKRRDSYWVASGPDRRVERAYAGAQYEGVRLVGRFAAASGAE